MSFLRGNWNNPGDSIPASSYRSAPALSLQSVLVQHMGRLFIIGSGPSLRETPLHKLIGEESWGMGRINKIYRHTLWRPTRVFWSDIIQEDTLPDILEHLDEDYDFYCRGYVSGALDGSYVTGPLGRNPWEITPVFNKLPTKIHNYEFCHAHDIVYDGTVPPRWRCSEDVYCSFGGTFQAVLMHGVEEGFNPIYVVAADLGFTVGGTGNHNNHFSDDYQWKDYPQYKADGKNRDMAAAHAQAREYAEERGIRIYNASMGGSLEAYERVDFNGLFE